MRNGAEGLLRAIAAHPAEETPRAMFLDWCEESAGTVKCPRCRGKGHFSGLRPKLVLGKPGAPDFGWWDCDKCGGTGRRPNGLAQWAEFIRVQCEREQIEAIAHTCRPNPRGGPDEWQTTCPACGACDAADDLRQREFELLTTLAERLAVPALHALWPGASHDVNFDGRVVSVVGGMRNGAVVFRQGHVAEVECTFSTWSSGGPLVVRSHPVERVGISDMPIFPSGGNYTFYVGGLGRFPRKYWRRLPTERAARAALSAACIDLAKSAPAPSNS